MKKYLGPLADVRSLPAPDPMSGSFFPALKPVSVSACQRHHSPLLGEDASKALFSKVSSSSEAGRGTVIVKRLQHIKPSCLTAQSYSVFYAGLDASAALSNELRWRIYV